MTRIDNLVNIYHGSKDLFNKSSDASGEFSFTIYGNPLQCSCNARSFVRRMVSALRGRVFVYPDMVKCEINGDPRANK